MTCYYGCMANRLIERQDKEWPTELPKKFVAVKVIITSTRGNILLVKPVYKPKWQFLGGGVAPLEDPKDAAVRELFVESGLKIQAGDLQIVGTTFLAGTVLGEEHDILTLIYEYTKRLDESIKLTLQAEENEDYKYVKPKDVEARLYSYYEDFWTNYLQTHAG